MDDLALARTVHVIAVIFWLGGVGFVTSVVMPMLMASEPPEDRLRQFQKFEARFSRQARVWVVLAGASGLWLIVQGNMWRRFAEMRFWWMHLMVAFWAIFALILFAIEPLLQQRGLAAPTTASRDLPRVMRLHQLLLIVGVITIFGAVGGSHGLF